MDIIIKEQQWQAETIFYQGAPGSFSFMAAEQVREKSHPAASLKPTATFEEIFIRILKEANALGVIPLENSLAGSVLSNYDLLDKYALTISGEIYLRVHHYLLSKANQLADIKYVTSHPQALQQCSDFIQQHHYETRIAANTAMAAQELSKSDSTTGAAIASKACAALYQLPVLAEKIENSSLNFTRFALINQNSSTPSLGPGLKCSILIKAAHQPGSLVQALRLLAEEGSNLTKIESRPNPNEPFTYTFYVDFECPQQDSKAVELLAQTVPYVKILGCYTPGELP